MKLMLMEFMFDLKGQLIARSLLSNIIYRLSNEWRYQYSKLS